MFRNGSATGASPARATAKQLLSMSHPHPQPTSVQGSGALQQAGDIPSMAAPESIAVPPKNPFRTRHQLPRTPLSSMKNGNDGSRNTGSRARSASVTKIPRSSHVARSTSPTRKPAGLSTPAGRSLSTDAGQGAGATVGENPSIITTPVADTRRIEEEMLAAFKKTPKVARTPPKGSAPSAPADAAAAAASLAGEKPASERLTAQLSTVPPAAAAGEEGLPSRGVAQHQPDHEASLLAARAAPQPAPAFPGAATASVGVREVPRENLIGSRDAPAPAESAAELVFGRSAKVARTPPRSDEVAGEYGLVGNSTGESQQQQQSRPQGIGLPPAAVHQSVSAAASRGAWRSMPPTAPAGGGAAGSPSRFASPSMSLDSSCTNAANVRSLAGSASKTADVVGGGGWGAPTGRTGAVAENCGALTPAAFKGLISVMRTPSTGMKRPAALVNEVPQMKSLDAVKLAAAHPPAPRGSVVPRFTNRAAAGRPRYASCVEEAKAAAEAAAAATAAKQTIAAAAAAAAAAGPTGSTAKPIAENTQAPPVNPSATSESAPSVVGENDAGLVASHPLPRAQEAFTAVTPLALVEENGPEASAVAGVPGNISNEAGGAELGVDPFVRSQKLPRTPTPAATAAVADASTTTEVAAPPCALPVTCNGGGVDGALTAESPPEAVTPVPSESEKEGKGSPEATACNPFASKSNIPRTPADQSAPPQLSLSQEGVGGDVEPMDVGEARLQIGELHQEIASMNDRLAKQAEERNRMADAAFEAQDEATKLRQQLQEIQQRQTLNSDSSGSSSGGAAADNGKLPRQLLDGEGGSSSEAGMMTADCGGETSVGTTAGRVVQLEIEKWETEQGKQEAEEQAKRAAEEARLAKVALDEARAKVRELTLSAEARHEELLEQKLRRDREVCKQDERAIEELQIKVKIFMADKRAEILRREASEEERTRAAQGVRSAAVAVAGKACKVVREFVARNARMSRRVAELRASVEEREERVSQLKEKSALLKASGTSAQGEAEAVRELLAAATEELEDAKTSSGALGARLGTLEKECRDAQIAQESLRALVDAEEARRVTVEQRLSEVKRNGENVVGIERARRQSTERRLGLAERSRDDLAATAASAASSALRKEAENEKNRRLSVERRLEYAEKARTELSATVAESAASAAAAAASAAAASTAASEAAALRQADLAASRMVVMAPLSAAALSPPRAATAAVAAVAVAPVPTRKTAAKKSSKKADAMAAVATAPKTKTAAKKNSKKAESPTATAAAVTKAPKTKTAAKKNSAKAESEVVAGGGGSGSGRGSNGAAGIGAREVTVSPPPKRVSKRASSVEKDGSEDDSESLPAKKVIERRKSAAAKKPAAAPARTGSSGKRKATAISDDDDDDEDAPAVPSHVTPAPTTTTGRTGRKRKQINYAESSVDLDSSDENVAAAVRARSLKGRRSLAGSKGAAARYRRSVIANLSDASSDEGEDEDDRPPAARATKQKKKATPVVRDGKKEPRTAVDGAEADDATAAKRSGTAVQSVTEGDGEEGSGASAKASSATGKGKGKARRPSSLVPEAAEGGRHAAAAAAPATAHAPAAPRGSESQGSGGGKESASVAAPASVVEKPAKKKRHSTNGKKGNASVDGAAGSEGGGSVSATTNRGSKKAGARKSVSRASKVAQEPQQKADLLSTDLSPIPPPQKRPRKLLGGGASRCKTPKAKKKPAASRTADEEDTTAPPAAAPTVAAAAALPARAAGVGPKSGLGLTSGSESAAMIKKAAAAAPAGAVGRGGGGGSSGGGAPATKPAFKHLKLSTTSILAMRGKPSMKSSLFKGFLDPKNGFKVPKLKAREN